jgi:hypothetical protein
MTFSADWQIPLPCCNLFNGLANPIVTPQSFQRAGRSHRRTTIFSTGWRILLPHRNLFSGPVDLIAAPQSFQRACESYCRAAIFSVGRRISSPRRNLFNGLAIPIVSAGQRMPPAKSHLDRRIIIVLAVSQFILKKRIIIELRHH